METKKEELTLLLPTKTVEFIKIMASKLNITESEYVSGLFSLMFSKYEKKCEEEKK